MEDIVKSEWTCCRVCLGTTKLLNIEQYGLLETFQILAGTEVPSDEQTYLCNICATLLLKYAAFRRRCKESSKILNNANKKDKITEAYHPYKKSETYITEFIETTRLNIAEVVIHCKSDLTSNIDMPHASVKTEDFDDIELKVENDLEELPLNEDLDSDIFMDVPTQNTENEAIINEVKVPRKMRKNKFDNGLKNSIENSNEIDRNENVPMKFKQKGKYFETKENMANFERIYDVDITVLTKEQQIQYIREKDLFNYPYRCEDCFKGFMNEANLVKHNRALHDPSRGSAVCDVCKSRYKDKRDLNRHMKSHRLKFTCRRCKYVSKNTSNAAEHFKMHSGLSYKCEDCGKTYEKQSTYLTHIRLIHPSQLIWCELCGESFVSDFGLNGHKKLAHKEVKFPPDSKCDCGTQFMNSQALKRHTDISGCDSVANCLHCGDKFTTKLMLKDHLLKIHRERSSKGDYPCVKCDKRFPREHLYSAHYRRVHAAPNVVKKTVICELCGKALANKCELKYHQRSHTGERPFKCPQCPKGFIKAALMKNHMRVHSSERPFACKLCPKTFKGPAALNGHQYVHTGLKPPVRRKKRPQFVTEALERIS